MSCLHTLIHVYTIIHCAYIYSSVEKYILISLQPFSYLNVGLIPPSQWGSDLFTPLNLSRCLTCTTLLSIDLSLRCWFSSTFRRLRYGRVGRPWYGTYLSLHQRRLHFFGSLVFSSACRSQPLLSDRCAHLTGKISSSREPRLLWQTPSFCILWPRTSEPAPFIDTFLRVNTVGSSVSFRCLS